MSINVELCCKTKSTSAPLPHLKLAKKTGRKYKPLVENKCNLSVVHSKGVFLILLGKPLQGRDEI